MTQLEQALRGQQQQRPPLLRVVVLAGLPRV